MLLKGAARNDCTTHVLPVYGTPKVAFADDLKGSHSYRCLMAVVLWEILYFDCRASY